MLKIFDTDLSCDYSNYWLFYIIINHLFMDLRLGLMTLECRVFEVQFSYILITKFEGYSRLTFYYRNFIKKVLVSGFKTHLNRNNKIAVISVGELGTSQTSELEIFRTKKKKISKRGTYNSEILIC
jgi:hypothetical protein